MRRFGYRGLQPDLAQLFVFSVNVDRERGSLLTGTTRRAEEFDLNRIGINKRQHHGKRQFSAALRGE